MADQKISALTGATTPLAGTEVLPIVQSSTTVKVSVANLTAGREVSATSVATGLGLVGTPAYTFTGDLNTGVWSPAADTVAVSTAGVERVRVDSTGGVTLSAAGKGIQSQGGLSNSIFGTVAASGFLDLPISANGFVGTLSVSTTRTNYTPQSRRQVYAIGSYGTTMTTTLLHTQDGTGGGSTFSLSVVGGAIRVTDTAGVANVDIYIAFSGAFSYGS
jgi:hypothetical protein